MRRINIHEAKTHLSRLVDQASQGDSFVIAKAGKPMVKVVPLEAKDLPSGRRLGFLDDDIAVPDDFNSMGAEEIERLFNGEP